MQGIIEQAGGGKPAPKAAKPMERDPNAGTTADGVPGAEPASDEEQQDYDRVMMASYEILYSEETNPGIMQMMKAAANAPEVAMADAVRLVLTQVDEAAGGAVPIAALFQAVGEVSEMVAELGGKAQLFNVPIDEAMANRVAQEAVLKMADEYEIDPAGLQGLIDGLDDKTKSGIQQQQEGYAQVPPERQAQPQAPPQQQGAPA